MKAEPKIRLYQGLAVEEVLGNATGMTGVRLRDVHGKESELPASGLFTLVGLEPNSALTPAQVVRDEHGYLEVNDELETALPGLWAIGQVRSNFAGWLKDATADARRAAGLVKARIG